MNVLYILRTCTCTKSRLYNIICHAVCGSLAIVPRPPQAFTFSLMRPGNEAGLVTSQCKMASCTCIRGSGTKHLRYKGVADCAGVILKCLKHIYWASVNEFDPHFLFNGVISCLSVHVRTHNEQTADSTVYDRKKVTRTS